MWFCTAQATVKLTNKDVSKLNNLNTNNFMSPLTSHYHALKVSHMANKVIKSVLESLFQSQYEIKFMCHRLPLSPQFIAIREALHDVKCHILIGYQKGRICSLLCSTIKFFNGTLYHHTQKKLSIIIKHKPLSYTYPILLNITIKYI